MDNSVVAVCAPVFKYSDSESADEMFFGTVCSDSSPIKDVGKTYFPEVVDGSVILFNNDADSKDLKPQAI